MSAQGVQIFVNHKKNSRLKLKYLIEILVNQRSALPHCLKPMRHCKARFLKTAFRMSFQKACPLLDKWGNLRGLGSPVVILLVMAKGYIILCGYF
jgi:hypothetical protein